jgi:K+-transporting ATPase KdpF subunit
MNNSNHEATNDGCIDPLKCRASLRADLRTGFNVRTFVEPATSRPQMNAVYLISGIIAAGLLFYLIVALLHPEKFE